MKWSDVRYGTVVRTTEEGFEAHCTMMLLAFSGNSEQVASLILTIDVESDLLPRGEIVHIGAEDFWRFEVVE